MNANNNYDYKCLKFTSMNKKARKMLESLSLLVVLHKSTFLYK